ncbi:MAG: hypothetical protein NTU79_02165 [Planctomycetota bacterium]|nr:hypothetical protein [Planctomycetota bacterium]
MEVIVFSKVPTVEPVPGSLFLIPPNVPRAAGATPYLSMVITLLSVAYTFAGESTHRDIEYARVGDVSLKLDLISCHNASKDDRPPPVAQASSAASLFFLDYYRLAALAACAT